MQSLDLSSCIEDHGRQSSTAHLQIQRKSDVVYIRMDSPSKLEDEYEIGPVIGEGTFGIVHRGVQRKDGFKCAIKKILREKANSTNHKPRWDQEISILRLVNHPGIIKLLAVAETMKVLFLVTELCEGDSLSTCLNALPKHTVLEEYVVVEIVRQITSALSYLHNRGIVHRDLKTSNIMLLHKVELDYRQLYPDTAIMRLEGSEADTKSESADPTRFKEPRDVSPHDRQPRSSKLLAKYTNKQRAHRMDSGPSVNKARRIFFAARDLSRTRRYTLNEAIPISPTPKQPPPLLRTKIIDFGLAIEVRKIEEALDSQCGTLLYMAPEVLAGRSYTRQCDVWSLGILTYELLTRQFPCNAPTEKELVKLITSFDIRKAPLPSMSFVSTLALDCLKRVLHPDPAYRVSASELLLDPWITQYRQVNNDEIGVEVDEGKRLSYSPQSDTVPATRLTPGCCEDVRPVSTTATSTPLGGAQQTSNVLELMKQYHKELTDQKLQLQEFPPGTIQENVEDECAT